MYTCVWIHIYIYVCIYIYMYLHMCVRDHVSNVSVPLPDLLLSGFLPFLRCAIALADAGVSSALADFDCQERMSCKPRQFRNGLLLRVSVLLD